MRFSFISQKLKLRNKFVFPFLYNLNRIGNFVLPFLHYFYQVEIRKKLLDKAVWKCKSLGMFGEIACNLLRKCFHYKNFMDSIINDKGRKV